MLPSLVCGLFLASVSANSYNPHKPFPLLDKTWFEGWYTRASFNDSTHLGLIFGSFVGKVPGEKNLVSVLTAGFNGRDDTRLKAFNVNPKDLVIGRGQNCAFDALCFTATSETLNVTVSNEEIRYSVVYQDGADQYRIKLVLYQHTPWSQSSNQGPEGALELFGSLLPLHWYVLSVRSTASLNYEKLINGEWERMDMKFGSAHVEKNWGRAFPSEWIWTQVNRHNYGNFQDHFVATGGNLGVLDFTPYLLSLKCGAFFMTWTPADAVFRPLKIQIKPDIGRLRISGVKDGIQVSASFKSNLDNFKAVQCPTVNGFVDFAVEDYYSDFQLTLTDSRNGQELCQFASSNAALEFGGKYAQNLLQRQESLTLQG